MFGTNQETAYIYVSYHEVYTHVLFILIQATDVSKPAPKRSTISLFDDDEDEDGDDEDIFSIKPSTKVFCFFLGV